MSTEQATSRGTYTQVSHVRARYEGTIPQAREARVTTLIGDAERILRGRVPRLRERVADGQLDVEDVQRVVAQAVIRAMRPGGGLITQHSTTEGGFTENRSYAAGSAARERTGGVEFTDGELDDLREHDGTPDGFGVAHQSLPAWRIP